MLQSTAEGTEYDSQGFGGTDDLEDFMNTAHTNQGQAMLQYASQNKTQFLGILHQNFCAELKTDFF